MIPGDFEKQIEAALSKDFDALAELPEPLESIAYWMSGDWGGSQATSRKYIQAVYNMGFSASRQRAARDSADMKSRLGRISENVRESTTTAVEAIERLSEACEAALSHLESMAVRPGGVRARLRDKLREALGRPK